MYIVYNIPIIQPLESRDCPGTSMNLWFGRSLSMWMWGYLRSVLGCTRIDQSDTGIPGSSWDIHECIWLGLSMCMWVYPRIVLGLSFIWICGCGDILGNPRTYDLDKVLACICEDILGFSWDWLCGCEDILGLYWTSMNVWLVQSFSMRMWGYPSIVLGVPYIWICRCEDCPGIHSHRSDTGIPGLSRDIHECMGASTYCNNQHWGMTVAGIFLECPDISRQSKANIGNPRYAF